MLTGSFTPVRAMAASLVSMSVFWFAVRVMYETSLSSRYDESIESTAGGATGGTGGRVADLSTLQLYERFQKTYPLRTTMLSSLFLWALSDSIAQWLEKKMLHDTQRTMRLCTYAVIIFSPCAIVWYGFLDASFPTPGMQSAVFKVLLDQTLWACTGTMLFFSCTKLLEGHTWQSAVQFARAKLWPTLKVNWLVWPAVQLANFGLVPPAYKILVINLVSIPWSAYLAVQAASTTKPTVVHSEQLKDMAGEQAA